MKPIIGINGVCGRMGQRLIHLIAEDKEVTLGAALGHAQDPRLGRDVGDVCGIGKLGVTLQAAIPLEQHLDVVIDFSTPEGTLAVLPTCVQRRIPILVATTGHSAEQRREIDESAHETAVLIAANTSLAVNVLIRLVEESATMLRDKNFDVEIIEAHHRFKKDSPSGTALHIARTIQAVMGQRELRHGRHGLVGERPSDEIGIHAVRVGDNVGEHRILFSTLGETLELCHRAHTRDCYARGALQAAKWLADRPAGRYSMRDVLGL